MLTLKETRIDDAGHATARWGCNTRGVLYFKVYTGLNPNDKVLLSSTGNCSISGIRINTPAHNGTVYITVEALNDSNTVIDTLEFRIMPEDIVNYLKYRKWFEDNFLKAARRSAAGVQLAVLQRRFTGEQCTRCVTSVSGEPEDPRCPVCFGTGFVDGFYTPLIVYGLRGPATEVMVARNTSSPIKKVTQAFILPPYPVLQSGDYIVDLSDRSMYEVGPVSQQLMEMDHQRLGSTSYETDRLNRDHPLSVYSIDPVLPSVEAVSISGNVLSVSGRKLTPRYGVLKVTVVNTDNPDPMTSDDALYSYDDLLSVTDSVLRFRIDSRFTDNRCRYFIVVNGLYFEGEVTNG